MQVFKLQDGHLCSLQCPGMALVLLAGKKDSERKDCPVEMGVVVTAAQVHRQFFPQAK